MVSGLPPYALIISDFAKLVAPLEGCYCPDFGRPAVHPEVMARALFI